MMMLEPRGEVALTDEQTRILMALTRTASVLSAIGVITIITTFCMSRHFRNPMHRLIFINAFFNAFDVTCTMISVSGPQAGNKSALCQFQGFLNQMFPVADVYWTLVMAVDVYLIVFHCYDTNTLRKLEWKYFLGISLLTFIPALVLLLVDTKEKGSMYGSVTIWCAIAPKWVLFRILIYYVPIWFSIAIIIVLYCMVGLEIVKRHQALKSIATDSSALLDLDDTVMPAEEPSAIPVESSPSINHSSHRSSDGPVLTTKRSYGQLHTPKRSSLSFRQYILLPLFFFLALLTVWVAPSTNRVATFIDPAFASFPLLVTVGVTGSLRGFWNGLVFIAVGMKSWKRRREEEEIALRPPTTSDQLR